MARQLVYRTVLHDHRQEVLILKDANVNRRVAVHQEQVCEIAFAHQSEFVSKRPVNSP